MEEAEAAAELEDISEDVCCWAAAALIIWEAEAAESEEEPTLAAAAAAAYGMSFTHRSVSDSVTTETPTHSSFTGRRKFHVRNFVVLMF